MGFTNMLIESELVYEEGLVHEADLTGDSRRVESAILNILEKVMKGEPLQILHLSGFSGMQEWRQFVLRYSLSAPRRGSAVSVRDDQTRQGRHWLTI